MIALTAAVAQLHFMFAKQLPQNAFV